MTETSAYIQRISEIALLRGDLRFHEACIEVALVGILDSGFSSPKIQDHLDARESIKQKLRVLGVDPDADE